MGSNGASSGGGGSNRYEPPKKKNPVVEFIKGGGITGAVIRGVGDAYKKGKEQNRRNKLTSQFASEEGIIKSSINMGGGNGGNNSNKSVPLIPIAIAPTTSEISQSSATVAESPVITSEETITNANKLLLKKKARGRSSTILTSSTGVGSKDKLTLGKKSLLGA